MSPAQGSFDDNQNPALEMAYVLFMDIVGYSRMATDVQQETLRRLQRSVRSGTEFQRAQEQQRLISLPTGDGMALAFFTDPESCVRCAVETTRALKDQEGIPLRMGMHAGPVFRVADINANQNVAGEGINIAQRVMDCGDAGHILVSKSLGDVLRQLSGWMGALQDLGEVSVKHGVRVHVFNLLVEGAGNPKKPEKFTKQDKQTAGSAEGRTNWKKWALVAAGILIVASGVAWQILRRATPVYAYRPKIALLGFTDQKNSNDTEWVSRLLTQDLTSVLQAGEKVVTVPGETVAHMKTDLPLVEQTSYSPGTMTRVHNYLQCDYVIYGSYYDVGKEAGGRVQLNVTMQDTKTGEAVSFMDDGTELTLPDLASRVGAVLRSKLGLPNISASEASIMQAEMPSTQEASRFYADGLAQLWRFDLIGAQESLQKAIGADQNFSLAHAELAEVWRRQGYDERAKEEAQKALDLSTHLGREQKLRVEAGFQEVSFEWDEAAESYQALWRVVRERPEYAYRAAEVQIRGGKADAALATVKILRQQPNELANSPVLDLREAEAYEALGNAKSELTSAQIAADKAHSLGARMLEAEALWRVCGAKANTGDSDGAKAVCELGQTIATDTKYRLIVARTSADLGMIAMGHVDFASALAAEQKALEIAKNVGSQRDVIGALQNSGIVYANQGNHVESAKSYERALKVAEEIKDKMAILGNLNNIATEFQAAGEMARALEYYGKSLDLANETKDKSGQVDARNNLGSLQALQGHLLEGAANVREALRLANENELRDKIPSLLTSLGDIQVDQGNLAEAAKSYDDAFTASNKTGDKSVKSAAQISQSRMQFEAGDYVEAEKSARAAADMCQKSGMKEQEGAALVELAEALTAQGKLEEANSALSQAKLAQPADKIILLAVDLASIRLLARSGKAKEADKIRESGLKQSRKMGLIGWQLRLELIGGEWGLSGREKSAARLAIQKVETEAAGKGYKLIQERAKRLLSVPKEESKQAAHFTAQQTQ
jgi:tetratricopeptide (TPR) repeat protein/class 3 adenylate cyclase/TolB-like protein